MSVAPPPPAAPRGQRGLMAALGCITMFGVAASMTHPLISLRLEMGGWTGAMIGLSGAVAAVAQFALAPFMPRVINRTGLPPFLLAGALGCAAVLLLFPLSDDYWYWLGLRFLLGVAGTMLFLGSETWITAAAEPATRGRVLGLYATVLSLGFAMGPLIVNETGLHGWTPFLLCAALCAAAGLPLAAAWNDAPAPHEDDSAHIPPLRFIRTDPSIMAAVIVFGACEFGLLGLLPVWGVRGGLAPEQAAFLLTAMLMGNVALQIPLGALADRFNRRVLLMLCAATTLLGAALLPVLVQTEAALWPVLFVMGGLMSGLYTVALAELGARYAGRALVSANAAMIVCYGFGALVAPLGFGAAMDALDPHGLPLATGLLCAGYLALAFWRSLTSPRARV